VAGEAVQENKGNAGKGSATVNGLVHQPGWLPNKSRSCATRSEVKAVYNLLGNEKFDQMRYWKPTVPQQSGVWKGAH
jgi:hypothetical protein